MKKIQSKLSWLIVPTILISLEISAWAQKSPYDWALIQLDYIRQERIEHLNRFTTRLHRFAKEAAQDKKVIAFFEMNRKHFRVAQMQTVPDSLADKIEAIRKGFNNYYISNYFVFYDMLFVNQDGIAFYTLRKEIDTCMNLITERASIGVLGEVIANKPRKEQFIDFYHYQPSSEPAAFFVEPVYDDGHLSGWLVLQCAVNKLNSIFASTDDLGHTGETFLVNQKGLMLTESYFKGYSTILRQHLDDRNIKAKFKEKAGHRIVIDYRGATALSSFEVVAFLGAKWLVVAKIDKDEITTAHYKKHKKYYSDRLLAYLRHNPIISCTAKQNNQPVNLNSDITHRVDMDEFLKAAHNESLETWGISTCTALLATIPQRFSYLAHISPKDKIYNHDDTNLLAQITKKIKSFDIYPCERRDVLFFAIAPHLDSIQNVIDQLINDGFFLSQIRIAFKQNAQSAAVINNYTQNYLLIEWTMPDATKYRCQNIAENSVNVGEIIEKMM